MKGMGDVNSPDRRPGSPELAVGRVLRLGLMALTLAACNTATDFSELSSRSAQAMDNESRPTLSDQDQVQESRDYIENEGGQLWDVVIPEGGSITSSVEEIMPWNQWEGFAGTLISPDENRVVRFTGPEGWGREAITITSNLSEQGLFIGREDAELCDVRTYPEGSHFVFGKTSDETRNFQELFKGPLSGVDRYCEVRVDPSEDSNMSSGVRLDYTMRVFFVDDGGHWVSKTLVDMWSDQGTGQWFSGEE